MANDPHRDLLPVRDSCRNGKGFSDKFDHQILGKLSRCELEDRFLRLLDEQTHIKKLANSQEEKIKRLGTKLLRLINEKKSGKKFPEQNKETEDLHLRIIELEHENYTLKDKNTVLKQQLSTHTRHLVTHRSPIRSNHTSPVMTTRQPAPVVQTECACDGGNKNSAADMQLLEAESHIKELNKEIKCLHNKINFLEQSLEKNNLDNRKVKVSENIELIRLQRSLKQQAIQIASLQEQVKNSEKTQKILKEELVKAHNENDEALHLISLKQGEILNLCSKLEEKNLNKLEEDELNERIRDLMLERDCLKERSEFLMKTIIAKAEESGKIKELQKLLEDEKCKKEKLEEALEHLKSNSKSSCSEVYETVNYEKAETVEEQQVIPEKQEAENCICRATDGSESSRSPGSYFKCQSESSDTEPIQSVGKAKFRKRRFSDGRSEVEKMKLELELQYLKEMLRSQTLRCEAQQAEITRLMYELKLNESKCNETLQRLDWHLRIFEGLEMRALQNEMALTKNHEVIQEKYGKPEQVERLEKTNNAIREERVARSSTASPEERVVRSSHVSLEERMVRSPIVSQEEKIVRSLIVSPEGNREDKFRPLASNKDGSPSYSRNMRYARDSSLEDVPSRLVSKDTVIREVETPKESTIEQPRKRFIEQTFLESSEDEDDDFEKHPFESTLDKYPEQKLDKQPPPPEYQSEQVTPRQNEKVGRSTKEASAYSLPKPTSDGSFPSKPYELRSKKPSIDEMRSIKISILWFKVKAGSSLWKNDRIEMFFIDFSFLDVNGEETETPESVLKPKNPDEKCEFNFTQILTLPENKIKILRKLTETPESVLMVLKVVSDSEKFDETNEECEDVGGGIVTVRQFLEQCNKGPFHIQVKNSNNMSEVVGTIALSLEASTKLLNYINKT